MYKAYKSEKASKSEKVNIVECIEFLEQRFPLEGFMGYRALSRNKLILFFFSLWEIKVFNCKNKIFLQIH